MQPEGLGGVPLAHVFMSYEEVVLFKAFIECPIDLRPAFLTCHASQWRTLARMTPLPARHATLKAFLHGDHNNPIFRHLLAAPNTALERHWHAAVGIARLMTGGRITFPCPMALAPLREEGAVWVAQVLLPAMESAYVREEVMAFAVHMARLICDNRADRSRNEWLTNEAWMVRARDVPFHVAKSKLIRSGLKCASELLLFPIQAHIDQLFEEYTWSVCYGTRPTSKDADDVIVRCSDLPQLEGVGKLSFYGTLTTALIVMRIQGLTREPSKWFVRRVKTAPEPALKRFCFE